MTGPPVLVAALSGRALAQAARRAGARVLVADLFGDLDTRAAAERWLPLPGDLAAGVDVEGFRALVARLAGRIGGVVCGAGFEDRAEALEGLPVPLLGNGAEVVRRVKEPAALARLLAAAGLPHPAVRFDAPAEPGWIAKRAGASGGAHVGDAARATYWQRAAPGRPVSALFLADGREAALVGATVQWSDPAPGAPYRYGGCAGPLPLRERQAELLRAACAAVAATAGLRGLCGLDLLVGREGWHVIEVNPRPTAALDVFDVLCDGPLWRAHLEAAAGRLRAPRLPAGAARAAAVVHAPRRVRAPRMLPDWAADRPAPEAVIAAGEPVCTVVAEAASVAAVRRLVARRGAACLAPALEHAA